MTPLGHHGRMPRRLGSVLSRSDLPLAELCAARLDGELFAVDECFSPVDGVVGAVQRGAALAAIVPDRMIAERRSAAWIWGAVREPPVTHELCVDTRSRIHPPSRSRLTVREVILDEFDVVAVGGMHVTSPVRTCSDIARFSERFGDEEADIVRALLAVDRQPAATALAAALAYVADRRNLPHKRRALERLSRIARSYPALTR